MYERKNVIVEGPVFSLSGYGRHAQDVVMSLFNGGKYNVSVLPTLWASASMFQPSKEIDDSLMFMCNNKIGDGADFAYVKIGPPSEFRTPSKTCNVGICAGLEVEQYPASWAGFCNKMTAIVVPTNFAKDRMIKCGVSVPVYVVPEGVDVAVFHPADPAKPEERTRVDDMLDALPTKFNFLTVGQWLPGAVGEDRKNIPATGMAVINALLDDKDVGIVVKSYLHNNSSPDRYALFERFGEMFGPKAKDRVHLVHGSLSEAEMRSLYVHPSVKAFISLTHGEGYFRPLAEAMACDLPVIVTGWSGHMDYVRPELATVVGYDMGAVPQASWAAELLGPGQTWANPVFEEAENRIRRCRNSYSVAKERAVKMGEIMRRDWAMDATDKALDAAMEAILASVGSDTHTVQVGGRIIV